MTQFKNFFRQKEKHYFHLVDRSSLPILTSLSVFLLVLSCVHWFHPLDSHPWTVAENTYFKYGWIALSFVLLLWFLSVLKESENGYHTLVVRQGLRYGMALFIVSEIMFFFAFFWAFFHVSLAPSVAIGCVWPPKSIQALEIWDLPLTNTLLLLSSGFATTLAHKTLFFTDRLITEEKFKSYLLIAILLGIVFLSCQMIEYKYGVAFTWKENIYGSTFFVTTGFHGLHVTIGTVFLLFCLVRYTVILWNRIMKKLVDFFLFAWIQIGFLILSQVNKEEAKAIRDILLSELESTINITFPLVVEDNPYRLGKDQHVGFESAAWYWHFVDVVWIFLFLTVYWWGSY